MPYFSQNFDDRKSAIDLIVLHYTGMKTAKEALERLCCASSKVSAHYLIDTDGTLYPLVDESKRAWHAGVSRWKEVTDINSCSIGIELVNPGHEFGYTPFPENQINVLTDLLKQIFSRYRIPVERVLAHSDVAPNRKTDPGELFDWKRLALQGFGIWTDDFSDLTVSEKQALHEIGYDVADEQKALKAFCRHFYPEAVLFPEKQWNIHGRLAGVLKKFQSFY